MAYAVLLSLSQTINKILNNDHYSISNRGKYQLASLYDHVIFLKGFLEMFPNEAECIEQRIRNTANEAEDHLEHFIYDFVSKKSTASDLYDFDGIEEAINEFISISLVASERKTAVLGDTPHTRPSSSPTPAPVVNSVTIGLDDDLLKIKEILTGGSSKLQIIPVVGMGGIGKTTLAAAVYHDQLIVESFPVRAWATVSQDYSIQNIFAYILDSFGDKTSGREKDNMEERVYKSLKGRKYLIVLDDIWSTESWDEVKLAFPDDGNGSRIVLTTRIEYVASYASSSSYLHQMQFMESDQSWNLLKQKVFPDKDCTYKLERIGKDIAKSCGGLPLAIVLTAGILSTIDETPASWLEVAKKVGSDGDLEKILSLSYRHLPHHLRPCFLYIGCFPEDYEIRVSKLTKLWMAEGFLEVGEGVGEEYLGDLVRRNLVLVAKRKSDGKMKSCNVHDLVRDICKRRAGEENYQSRLSIAHPDPMLVQRSVRSLLHFQASFFDPFYMRKVRQLLLGLRLLRVLDLADVQFLQLPKSIFDLVHLRYLAVIYFPSGIMRSISKLNLHTLIFYRFKQRGPTLIPTMPRLTHFISYNPVVFDSKISGLDHTTLEKLETLSMVTGFICTKNMVEMIPNIKKLGIVNYGGEDYQLQNLVLLVHLEKLKLIHVDIFRRKSSPPIYPNKLRKLTLSGGRFPWTHMETTVGCLPNLQILKLKDFACEGDTWETKEEQFPSLECLYIDDSDLKNWVTEKSHFPMLKNLFLFGCRALTEIPDDVGDIPTLQLIQFDDANELLAKCVKRIQEDQHDNGNDGLQVRCVYDKKGNVRRLTLLNEYLSWLVVRWLPRSFIIQESLKYSSM